MFSRFFIWMIIFLLGFFGWVWSYTDFFGQKAQYAVADYVEKNGPITGKDVEEKIDEFKQEVSWEIEKFKDNFED